MKIFTALMMDDYMKRLTMEHYSTLELALTRACEWCHEVYHVNGNHNPAPQDCGDGSTIEYVVFQGDHDDVIVSVIELEVLTALPHFRGDFVSMSGDLSGSTVPTQTVAAVVPPADDPMDLTLPAGWDFNGKPIRMQELLDNPDETHPTCDLTEAQQWALAIARTSKRPNFTWSTIYGVFVQSSALHELKQKTLIGQQIMAAEMAYLDKVREDNCAIVDVDDNYDDCYYGSTT